MRTLFFDCFAGVSGDMVLGALVDVGVEPELLKSQLSLLNVPNFSIDFTKVDRSGISATKAIVNTGHEHHHRHLSDILKIILDSKLNAGVKDRATKVFTRLAEAEARIHNIPVERIHFHEVGAIDAIVDVVGAAIGFEVLGIERFYCSALHVGSGMVEMAHGRFPVPPPAVAELLSGAPIYGTEIVGELVTPTGAAIVSTVCKSFGPIPAMRVERTGYGAGSREYPRFPNVLRLLLGSLTAEESGTDDRLVMLETNVDDMNPQIAGHLMDRALELGALDCYFTSVQMKKNRPGLLISVLCDPTLQNTLSELLFAETTTLGIRSYEVKRRALEREFLQVETDYGRITVKVAKVNGSLTKVMPEFDECRKAAVMHNAPLREVNAAAVAAVQKLLGD